MTRTRILRNLKLANKSLLLHKLRSLLTMLGVVFGVASVIAMLAIGEGSKRHALEQIERLGTNNVIVNSRKPVNTGTRTSQGGNRVLTYGILYDDQSRVEETIPHVARTVPIRRIPKVARVGGRAVDIDVIGTTPAWFSLITREFVAGRPFTDLDMQRIAPVIVITEQLARRGNQPGEAGLLARSYAIGERVMLGDDIFTIVGIVKSEARAGEAGSTLDADMDAFIPLTTCRAYFGELIQHESAGSETREKVDLHQLIVEVEDRSQVQTVASAVRYMMQRFHPKIDYEVSVPLELLRQAEEVQQVWNMTLGSIAGISLLVGGIGIMNIMLASVTERTREIGIRRAIGAKRGQIISQFLTEALVLSIVGGAAGIGLGVILPKLIEHYSGFRTIVPMYSIVLSVGISVFVGVVFGLYPAVRAARLDPIEALRHE